MKTIQIADMHWGAVNPEKYYNEMHEFIIKYLRGIDELNIIFIAGDIFDSKHYLYSQTMVWFTKFYLELLAEAKRLDCLIVVIEGTKTHDAMQFSIIQELTRNVLNLLIDPHMNEIDPLKFGVFYTNKVEDFTWYNDNEKHEYKFLLMPEEYIADQESYYKDYFKNNYDMTIGHGMIDKIWYAKEKKSNKDTGVLSSPVFNVSKFKEFSKRTYFGHVHMYKYYGDDTGFTYIGPPSIWEFGKDRNVGMIFTEFNEGEFIKDELIINGDAPIYDTRVLNIDQNYELEDIHTQLDIMTTTATRKGVYKLRIIVNMQTNLSEYESMKDFIISKLSNEPMVKLIISTNLNNDDVENMKQCIDSEISKSLEESLGTDVSLPIPEQIRDFTRRDSGKDISIEVIKKHLEL